MEKTAPFCKDLPRKPKHTEIRKAVDKVLDSMEIGQMFSGSDLPDMCTKIEPLCANTEGETIRRYMRYYRERGRARIVCIDRMNGIYQKFAMEN